ncbi:hypothetical protein Lal_00021835 [Lupinus albus]|nr:hypothetical protein Lal_00021835 [Lupinus albus]
MEEESWENLHLHMEMNHDDDIFLEKCHNEVDDEFIREILFEQPPFSFENETNHSSFLNSTTTIAAAADGSVIPPIVMSNEHDCVKKPHNTLTTPRTCILSFGDSTMKPITHEHQNNNYELLLGNEEKPSNNENNKNKRKLGESRPRERMNKNQVMDHIMAERKRRQELTERFIALSATIPGLNKVIILII